MSTVLSKLFLVVLLAVPAVSQAAAPKHDYSASEAALMAASNEKVAKNQFLNNYFDDLSGQSPQKRDFAVATVPYAEYHEAGYVIFSEDTDYGSGEAKKKMAQNLPAGITLVVFTGNSDPEYKKILFNEYSQYIDSSRLKVVFLPGGGKGFWARDGIPVPVWKVSSSGAFEFSVVDARYYHNFEADKEVSELFGAGFFEHKYYFEGGNYTASATGNCIVVDNVRVQKMPDSIFTAQYGCKTLTRLPHTKGIGHIDESVKFVDDNTLIVDDQDYADTLAAKGFKVIKMVRPSNSYETYVNALVVNGTAFLPVFNQKTDIAAIEVYEKLGLKVVPLNSIRLSNDGLGSIHCITMSYPPVPFNQLLNQIGAHVIK